MKGLTVAVAGAVAWSASIASASFNSRNRGIHDKFPRIWRSSAGFRAAMFEIKRLSKLSNLITTNSYMNIRPIFNFVGRLSAAVWLVVCDSSWAASESLVTDSKDYSKEAPPIEKSWCETTPPFELRIGLPAWLAGLSGATGVKGLEASSDVTFDQLINHLTHFPGRALD